MNNDIIILESKIASIQDSGRYTIDNYGFSINGAMDQYAYNIGNALLYNNKDTPAIEVTAFNFSFLTNVDVNICVTGAKALVEVDEEKKPQWGVIKLKRGQRVKISNITIGLRVYICFSGDLDVPYYFGSASFDAALNVGKKLTKDDYLNFKKIHFSFKEENITLPNELTPNYTSDWVLDFCKSPDHAIFKYHIKFFEESIFKVSLKSDNTGIRLNRTKLTNFHPQHVLSKGIVPGAIEVTPSGQAIILHRGRGGTIGYPVIGCISTLDLDMAGQVRPNDTIRFNYITVDEAVKKYDKRKDALNDFFNTNKLWEES